MSLGSGMTQWAAAVADGPSASAVAAAHCGSPTQRLASPSRRRQCVNPFLAFVATACQLTPHDAVHTASIGLTSPEHVALPAQLLSRLHRLLHLRRGIGKHAGIGACRRDANTFKVTQVGRTADARRTAQQFNAAAAPAAATAATARQHGLRQQGWRYHSLVAAPCR